MSAQNNFPLVGPQLVHHFDMFLNADTTKKDEPKEKARRRRDGLKAKAKAKAKASRPPLPFPLKP